MRDSVLTFGVPLVGYASLWISGSLIFLIYFKIFDIPTDLKHTVAMIRKLPAPLAIVTVPICSFMSFFIATEILRRETAVSFDAAKLLHVGIISVLVTIVLDVLITVVGEKMDIRVFPVNLMYLFAWLVIIPAVVLAGL
ncbi:MAG: hypothetical protein ACYDGW_05775 [Vulcanimicrobiaceae bacterium]